MYKKGNISMVSVMAILIILVLITVIIIMGVHISQIKENNQEIKINLENEIAKNKVQEEKIQESEKEEIQKNEQKVEDVYNPLMITDENMITKDSTSSKFNYSIQVFKNYLSAALIPNANKVILDFNIPNITSMYQNVVLNNNNRQIEIKSTKKIQDVHLGGFGHAAEHEMLFMILEDGTVEYVKIKDLAQTGKVTINKINDVKEVVKIYQVGASSKDGNGGFMTNIAQRNDGKCYDLNEYIEMK